MGIVGVLVERLNIIKFMWKFIVIDLLLVFKDIVVIFVIKEVVI